MAAPPCTQCGSTQGPEHLCPAHSRKLLGKVLDGRYQIESVLGHGGMGMVFQGVQMSMRRQVAVKTLHPGLATAPTFFERFRLEAETASRLRHPNVITVYDFGRTEDGICYYVMELLRGESLRQIVKREGPLSLRRGVQLIEQAARGLAHAHRHGCVHRDLKPHNLMIQNIDGEEVVKILDFGLVKALDLDKDPELTSTGQVLGTPQYMPPEQAAGQLVDRRSDLYSLVAVLYFCLTGTSPFGANTARKAYAAGRSRGVSSVSSRRKGPPVPRSLDEFFRKGLARERENRYQSAEELITEMRAAIKGIPDSDLDAVPGPTAEVNAERAASPRSHEHTAIGRSKGNRTPSAKPPPPSNEGNSSRAEKATATVIAPKPSLPLSRKLAVLALPVLLFAVGAIALLRSRPRAVASSQLSPAPVAAPVAAKPLEISVTFVSKPSGATVLQDGVALGKTPLVRRFRRGEPHLVVFRLSGHQDVSSRFNYGIDETLTVSLPLAIVRPSSPKQAPARKPTPAIPVFD